MLKTRVTEMLGIEYPIIKGPMAYISRAELVAAVSNAGGMGIIASLSFETIDELRREIKRTKSLTDKPFAVNITLLPTARPVNYEDYFKATIDEGVKIIGDFCPYSYRRQRCRDPRNRRRRHSRRSWAGCRPSAGSRGRPHGHPLHVHPRSERPQQCQDVDA